MLEMEDWKDKRRHHTQPYQSGNTQLQSHVQTRGRILDEQCATTEFRLCKHSSSLKLHCDSPSLSWLQNGTPVRTEDFPLEERSSYDVSTGSLQIASVRPKETITAQTQFHPVHSEEGQDSFTLAKSDEKE